MCKHGTTETLQVWIPADLSFNEEGHYKMAQIDACIAPIVKALNDGGVLTIGCCCGHGKGPGNIILEDGRELIIVTYRDLNVINQ